MELKVYDWEKFERGKSRYIKFALCILLIVIISILWSNITWWVFLLLIAWAYIFYNTKVNNEIKMIIWKNALQIWKTAFSRNSLSWFVLEYHTKKEKIHNIVIIDEKKNNRIYTIKDTEKKLESFVKELNEYIPILDSYEQSTMDKFIRKLKL